MPGSTCRGRKDCPSALVCLSETCRCPELLPVLLRFDNSFACAPSRRLDERCLSHAECSHANEHARCLHSVCSCPPKFYATKASLLCLPDYLAWHPMRRVALFPALAMLVSAFLALGGLCYSKSLWKRRRFRLRLPRRFLPTAPKDSRELRYERFLKYLEGRSTCTRLSTASTTFRFETDYSYIEAGHGVLGRKTETPERDQCERGSPIDLHRQCSVELERKRSEGCSSSASFVRSNAVPGTGSIPSEALSTMTKTNSSMSVPHHVRRNSGSAGVQSDSSGSLSDTGALASGDSGPARNDASQIQRELFNPTLTLSQLPRLSENTQVTDAAVTVAVHDLVPSRLPVNTAKRAAKDCQIETEPEKEWPDKRKSERGAIASYRGEDPVVGRPSGRRFSSAADATSTRRARRAAPQRGHAGSFARKRRSGTALGIRRAPVGEACSQPDRRGQFVLPERGKRVCDEPPGVRAMAYDTDSLRRLVGSGARGSSGAVSPGNGRNATSVRREPPLLHPKPRLPLAKVTACFVCLVGVVASFEDGTASPAVPNLCNLAQEQPMYCRCSSEHFEADTTGVVCYVGKPLTGGHAVFQALRRQKALVSVTFTVYGEDYRLDFVPTDSLRQLGRLERLRFTDCNLGVLHTRAFYKLSTLTLLQLEGNDIIDLQPEAIAHLPRLEKLELGENKLRHVKAGWFSRLPSLIALFLGKNQIEYVEDLAFAELEALRELELGDNFIHEVTNRTFKGLAQLTRLDLYRNKLTRLDAGIFVSMPLLEELDLKLNQISVIDPLAFDGLARLRLIYLASNQLRILPADMFVGAPNLNLVDLEQNKLVTLTWRTIHNLKYLEDGEDFTMGLTGE
ncbi:hypothetical protein HPB52_023866 [Rhipicephalus sanguineus]|uniref:Uncharacterized protein n=1 Tax=Rhipicephalus sanguineus TaxID=34632 RepID=A0A9D4PU19_RHISA|nr:hypothetical protein HPB52_023866 [Rhipicephalus sanguineus]